ncbi:flavin reductase family protein [bacterium RCC_150]
MRVPPRAEKKFSVDDYRELFRRHASSVSIVTLGDADHPVGFTATSVISVSADPAVIMFSIMGNSSSWPALSRAKSVVLHLLDHSDLELARRFATSGIDRFEGVEWGTIESGEPVLKFHGTWARCEILGYQEVGGSYLIQVQPTVAAIEGDRTPLVYFGRSYHRLATTAAIKN